MSMRVGLFAPLNDVAVTTGTGKYVINLLSALAELRTEPDASSCDLEYVVLTHEAPADWLPDGIRDRTTVTEVGLSNRRGRSARAFDDLALDVVHFLVPVYFRTRTPTLFNPFDLRHLEYPDHLTTSELDRRRDYYPTGVRAATVVDTLSAAVADQLLDAYDGVDPEKVHPVPMGPALEPREDEEPASAEVDDRVPESFVLFPANLWPHKNHERLVEALERIERQHGERVPLVCTGIRDTPEVPPEHRLESVPEASQVLDLGYVTASELRALYRRSRLLVYPPLYEGGGLPVLEGWAFDTAVVCSDIPVLREKGGDAALYFDPESVPAMAETIHEAWTDASLRAELIERGQERRELFTWERTARAYRALYRKAAGTELSSADRDSVRYPVENG
jgi:glycosyltransferase involved in cell wall biosynthesis